MVIIQIISVTNQNIHMTLIIFCVDETEILILREKKHKGNQKITEIYIHIPWIIY